MRPAVGVHVFGQFRQAIGAGFAFVDHRILKERRLGRGFGEFGAERTVGAEGRLTGDQGRASDLPEAACAAVAERDFVAVGHVEEGCESFADGTHKLTHRCLTVGCAQQVGRAIVERGDLFWTYFAGPGAETTVFGQHIGRNLHCIGHGNNPSHQGGWGGFPRALRNAPGRPMTGFAAIGWPVSGVPPTGGTLHDGHAGLYS